MAKQIGIGMPQSLDIGPNYKLRVTALDATTGNLVAGVTVNTVIITATGTGDLSSGSFTMLTGQLLLRTTA